MTLYIIGLGLNDCKDITVKGLEKVKECDKIYLESYTSILQTKKEEIEEFYGKKIISADRNMVEKDPESTILNDAQEKETAFLVVGDPMGATTHADLILRAKKKNIEVTIIHNASIMNAIGATGLELYKFGKTTSICFEEDNWLPETPYDVIKQNKEKGLHTLCLLDIKTKEPSKKDIQQQKEDALPPRFMTVNDALQVLTKIEDKRKENIISESTFCVGIARLGADDQLIISGTVKELLQEDFGRPLHTLIIPGKLHFIEEEFLEQFRK